MFTDQNASGFAFEMHQQQAVGGEVLINRMRSSPWRKLRRMNSKRSSSRKRNKTAGQVTIGIDIGDQWSHYCTLSDGGEVIEEGRFRTSAAALAQHFAELTRSGLQSRMARIPSGSMNNCGDTNMK